MPCPEPSREKKNNKLKELHLPYFLSVWKRHRFPSCGGELRSQEFQQSHDLFPGSYSIWWRGARANYRRRKRGEKRSEKLYLPDGTAPRWERPKRAAKPATWRAKPTAWRAKRWRCRTPLFPLFF